MRTKRCPLDGILLIEPVLYHDKRGFFLESYQEKRYSKIGITEKFVQDNYSRSEKNVLRGLHFTLKKPQSQIVTVICGKIFDVVVDIRKDSPTFGNWFGTELSDQGTRQIYMPHGFAHGFCVLSEWVDLHYKVSQKYDPFDESGIIWNDNTIKIDWPILKPNISAKDLANKKLEDL